MTHTLLPPDALMALKPDTPIGERLVILAGNPNVGKSVFFNALTGLYVNVSNFPGTTVDIPRGKLDDTTTLQDTPGIYGLSGMSEEETVAEKAILKADVVINVVSAISLERDLFLTQQLIDYGRRLIIAVNQMDEAQERKVSIDCTKLSELLGVPVYPCIATKNQGLDDVKQGIWDAKTGNTTPDSPPPEVLQEEEKHPGKRLTLYGHRRHHVNAIVANVVHQQSDEENDPTASTAWKNRFSKKLGDAFLTPFIGLLAMAGVLLTLYQVIGVWVAGDIVDFTEGTIMLGYVVPFLKGLVESVIPSGNWFHALLVGEFGVITMSIQYIYGVLFPLVLGFYIYISLLEDCGYLPRVAVLSDSLLSRIGLNGRAVIPMILGFGCVTMATVSTRVLNTQRERTIASTILAITVPCSAQLAVIMALMASAGGLKGWLVYIACLFSIMVGLGSVLNLILPGKSSPLVLDLPPMRMPLIKNVLQKTWARTRAFIREAAPLFVLGSAIVAILQVSGLLAQIQVWLSPVTVSLLHLPGETATAFVMGMVRRDFGAAGLLHLGDSINAVQMLTALMVITLFVPCIASAAVFWKERGIKEATMILIGSWLFAFGVGTLLCRLLEWIPIL